MKRISPKTRFLLVMAVTFVFGVGVDVYLRANKGMACFGCRTYSCMIVEIADHPSLLLTWARDGFRHPLF